MSKEVLKIIGDAMKTLGIPYAFGVYNKKPLPTMYFVGEYSKIQGFTEDGLQEATVMLTGYSRGSCIELFDAREEIERHFSRYGLTTITPSGSGVAIMYANTLVIPTGDAEFKRIQVNLQVKEWRVE